MHNRGNIANVQGPGCECSAQAIRKETVFRREPLPGLMNMIEHGARCLALKTADNYRYASRGAAGFNALVLNAAFQFRIRISRFGASRG